MGQMRGGGMSDAMGYPSWNDSNYEKADVPPIA